MSLKLSKEQILKCFQKSKVCNEEDTWLCVLCAKKIKQRKGCGFSNLRSHILIVHPNYQISESSTLNINNYIRPKSSNVYGWVKKVVLNCQPLCIVENPIELEFTNLKPICRQTLRCAIVNTAKEVRSVISAKLPSKFCICFDAWTENKNHFVGIYAIHNDDYNNSVNLLLGFTTLLDESNWTAQNYADTIIYILESFGKSIINVICLVGDNCNTNKRLANILNLPLIGCASHKLNLAVENYLEDFTVIKVINQLMTKLAAPLKLATLRKSTALRPIIRNATRWSSCFDMIERFFAIKDYLNTTDTDIAALMPNQVQILQLGHILEELRLLNELTIYLQKSTLNLANVRKCFDKVSSKHSNMKKYLDVNSPIVHCPYFDSGIIKVLEGNEEQLNDEEKQLISKLLRNEGKTEPSTVTFCNSHRNPYIIQSPSVVVSKYMDLNFIPPTSNIEERLFSLSKRVYNDHRRSLDNSILEDIIFLNQNNDLWSADTVDKSIK